MTKDSLTLAPATPDDREELLKLHKSARYETEIELVPEYAKETVDSGYYEKLWRQQFTDDGYQIIAAKIGNELVGFCRFGLLDEQEYPAEKLGSLKTGLGELHQLYVTKQYRGLHGIGRKLYSAALRLMHQFGYKCVLIAMVENNTAARAFYEKLGAEHLYTYLDTMKRGDKILHKNVAVYVHKNI
jgi:ribosomal protein S18 acetylase RimI-like enzyme